ncbi:MAG TPA: magnesium transporter [Verrucomicrobiales bacterium]|nr:magnesium transporter [Verrucomicrobiales bacterium]
MEEEDPVINVQESLVAAMHEGDPAAALTLMPEIHPAELAAAYETLAEEERAALLPLIPAEALPPFLQQLPAADAVEILGGMPDGPLAAALEELSDDILVDLLQEMPSTQRGRTFHLLSEARHRAARELLRYPEDTAGGRMTTAFAAVREDMTVREAIEALRKVQDETEILARIYVVDYEGLILGKVRLRDLTFAPQDQLIADLNDNDTRAVLATADQEKALRVMVKYDMLALPVVDDDGRLLGVITHDDALDIQEEESTEDLERQSGIAGDTPDESYLNTPVLRQVRRRIGWIISLGFLGLISGCVIYSYQNQLNSVFALTIYMPMIVAAGGNTGGQAATMVIRAMSLGEFSPGAIMRVAWKELRVGVVLGAALSFFMVLQIFLFRPAFMQLNSAIVGQFSATVGLALLTQITASTLIGAVLPIGARALKLDPAVIASPAITTIVDATGLLIYLNFAIHILNLS